MSFLSMCQSIPIVLTLVTGKKLKSNKWLKNHVNIAFFFGKKLKKNFIVFNSITYSINQIQKIHVRWRSHTNNKGWHFVYLRYFYRNFEYILHSLPFSLRMISMQFQKIFHRFDVLDEKSLIFFCNFFWGILPSDVMLSRNGWFLIRFIKLCFFLSKKYIHLLRWLIGL